MLVSFSDRRHVRHRKAARRMGVPMGIIQDLVDLVSSEESATKVGTPGAIPVRPGSWDLTRTPAEYVIDPGDTMVGIAATYLGAGDRWGEIRAYQTNPPGSTGPNGKYLNASYNKWFPGSTNPGPPFQVGNVLLMPPEAVTRLQAYIANQTPTAPPGAGNAPGNFPGADKTAPKQPSTTETATATAGEYKTPLLVLGGLGVLAVGTKLAGLW